MKQSTLDSASSCWKSGFCNLANELIEKIKIMLKQLPISDLEKNHDEINRNKAKKQIKVTLIFNDMCICNQERKTTRKKFCLPSIPNINV